MPELTDAQLEKLIKDIGLKRPRGGSERKPIAHGTYRGARQHRYRKEPLCEPCRLAENSYNAARQRKRRAAPERADQAGHGTISTYNNYACRCTACRAAQAAYMRALRARRNGGAQ